MGGDEVGHAADIVKMKHGKTIYLLARPVGGDRHNLRRAAS
jgi:hypothetical protein